MRGRLERTVRREGTREKRNASDRAERPKPETPGAPQTGSEQPEVNSRQSRKTIAASRKPSLSAHRATTEEERAGKVSGKRYQPKPKK
jgi:hypothetical protein